MTCCSGVEPTIIQMTTLALVTVDEAYSSYYMSELSWYLPVNMEEIQGRNVRPIMFSLS